MAYDSDVVDSGGSIFVWRQSTRINTPIQRNPVEKRRNSAAINGVENLIYDVKRHRIDGTVKIDVENDCEIISDDEEVITDSEVIENEADIDHIDINEANNMMDDIINDNYEISEAEVAYAPVQVDTEPGNFQLIKSIIF